MDTYKPNPPLSHASKWTNIQRDQDDEGNKADDEIETLGEMITKDALRRK